MSGNYMTCKLTVNGKQKGKKRHLTYESADVAYQAANWDMNRRFPRVEMRVLVRGEWKLVRYREIVVQHLFNVGLTWCKNPNSGAYEFNQEWLTSKTPKERKAIREWFKVKKEFKAIFGIDPPFFNMNTGNTPEVM